MKPTKGNYCDIWGIIEADVSARLLCDLSKEYINRVDIKTYVQGNVYLLFVT